MNDLLIDNATVVTLDSQRRILPGGAVLIRRGVIEEVGPSAKVSKKAEGVRRLDAEGNVVLPGYICVHHHLYSTFARGIPLDGYAPRNFSQILKGLWWKLDRTLQEQDILWSAYPPLVECIRRGTTTIVDHHESQGFQSGSLDVLQVAVQKAGVRAVLALGVSDRYGRAREGIQENERFIKKSTAFPSDWIAPMAGLHASFTVEEDTLRAVSDLARRYRVGVHTHAAEDAYDQSHCLRRYKKRVLQRFDEAGLLNAKTLLAHCIHVDRSEMRRMAEKGVSVAHNPESNMNNAVGAARLLELMKEGICVGLGTDGMSSDMPSQARAAYLLQRHARRDPRAAFAEACGMLFENNARIIEKAAGWKVGALQKGSLGDAIVVRYIPPTPLNADNLYGHLMFGLGQAPVLDTVSGGEILMKKGR
ncbi:MAG: putative aminohydrolase SsnA, partial [Elusimicrobia bacterium]|nr:putative aminohydrolase SsnA [Elusimicrobiota bacterium]